MQQRLVSQPVLLYNIADDQCVEHFAVDIAIFLRLVFIEIGTGHAAFGDILRQAAVKILRGIIGQIFCERERENMNLIGASDEESCQIAALQKSVGAGDIDIIFFFRVQTVDRLFEGRTHLYLIDHEIVVLPRLIMVLCIALQSVVFHQLLEVR